MMKAKGKEDSDNKKVKTSSGVAGRGDQVGGLTRVRSEEKVNKNAEHVGAIPPVGASQTNERGREKSKG